MEKTDNYLTFEIEHTAFKKLNIPMIILRLKPNIQNIRNLAYQILETEHTEHNKPCWRGKPNILNSSCVVFVLDFCSVFWIREWILERAKLGIVNVWTTKKNVTYVCLNCTMQHALWIQSTGISILFCKTAETSVLPTLEAQNSRAQQLTN